MEGGFSCKVSAQACQSHHQRTSAEEFVEASARSEVLDYNERHQRALLLLKNNTMCPDDHPEEANACSNTDTCGSEAQDLQEKEWEENLSARRSRGEELRNR